MSDLPQSTVEWLWTTIKWIGGVLVALLGFMGVQVFRELTQINQRLNELENSIEPTSLLIKHLIQCHERIEKRQIAIDEKIDQVLIKMTTQVSGR